MKQSNDIKMPKGVKKAIQTALKTHLHGNEVNDKMKSIDVLYDRFQKEQPYIGGKKNVLWEQVYTSLAVFAYYEVMEKKPTLHEIEELTTEALIGNNRIAGKFVNFNWKWFQKLYGSLYKRVKKQTDLHLADGSWNNTWQFELNPDGRKEGVYVRLIGCPVFDFAKSHGYEELMPALCRSDYRVFEPFHCRMIRYRTVANGDGCCDFWQVGDKSEAWQKADKSRLI